MKKLEVFQFLLERIWCAFEFGVGEGDARKSVEVFLDGQASCGAGYDYRVRITSPEGRVVHGSSASWGADARVSVSPNEESAVVAILPDGNGELKDLFLVRFKRTGTCFRDWWTLMKAGVPFGGSVEEAVQTEAPDLLGVERLCSIAEARNLRCGTGGGWEVDFYLERLPGEQAGEEGDRWVGILHRSNGAVTVCRQREDFPF